MSKKLRAGHLADTLLRQRLALLRHYQDIARAMYEAEQARMEQHQKKLRAYLETLKLEEEIEHQIALRTDRLKTKRLEESGKRVRLLREMEPPPPPPPTKLPPDPFEEAVTEHRRQFKVRASTKRLVFSDFLEELQRVFRAHEEDRLKAARIRIVMDVYGQEMDALPKAIREFLEEVEESETMR